MSVALLPVVLCICRRLDLFFTSSSLSSTKDRNLWRVRPDLEFPWLEVSASSSGACRRYWRNMRKKNMRRASKHATPHMRNKPQKLFRWSRSESSSSFAELHALLVSHLSWILWRSPFSDSERMAVDRSTAKGESLGNIWNRVISMSRKRQDKLLHHLTKGAIDFWVINYEEVLMAWGDRNKHALLS